jgi:hypothetical protein
MLFTVEVCVAGTLEEEEGSHNTIYAVYHQPISMSTFMIKIYIALNYWNWNHHIIKHPK